MDSVVAINSVKKNSVFIYGVFDECCTRGVAVLHNISNSEHDMSVCLLFGRCMFDTDNYHYDCSILGSSCQ